MQDSAFFDFHKMYATMTIPQTVRGFLFVVACAASLGATQLHAQSKTDRAEVAWGDARNLKQHGIFSSLVHHTEDKVYVVVYRKRDPWLQMFNTDQVMLKEIPLPLEMGSDDHAWEDLMFLEDKVVFFTTYYEKDQKRTTLYARSYSLDDLQPEVPMKALVSLNAESKKDKGWINVEAEGDGSGFRVWATAAGQTESQNIGALVRYYSSDLELLEQGNESRELPFPTDEYEVETSYWDDDGTNYMVVRKYPEKRERKARKREGVPTFDMVLVVYEKGTNKPELFPIKAGGRFLQDLRMTLVDDKNEIVCAGFYGNEGNWAIRGAFVLRLDRTTKSVKHESYKEFDLDFITSYLTEKEERKATKMVEKKNKDIELFEYDLNELVVRDDGGVVLVGEQYFMQVVTVTTTDSQGRMQTSTSYHYYYNNIILVSTDAAGDISWAIKVPKRQHTVNDGGYYSSYAMAVKGNSLYFIFNDNGKNLFLAQGDKIEQFRLKGKEALITLVTVDVDGRMTREALLDIDRRDAFLQPKSCVQLEDDRMFIYAERQNEYRFGTIVFK